MNFLENFAITMIIGLLNTVIKNPALKAALESQLVGIATDIATVYGFELVPAQVPAIPVNQPAKVQNPQPGRPIVAG